MKIELFSTRTIQHADCSLQIETAFTENQIEEKKNKILGGRKELMQGYL